MDYSLNVQIHIWFSNYKAAIEDDANRRSMKLYEEMKEGRKPTRSDTCEYAEESRCTVVDTYFSIAVSYSLWPLDDSTHSCDRVQCLMLHHLLHSSHYIII